MRLTDKRLYQARNLEDLAFRYWFRDEDNRHRRGATREAVFYADKAFVAPDTNRIWGPDVSGRWDGKVDFSVTAAYGAKFGIVKAIDGTVPTAYWRENNQSAYDAGLLNTTYAWLYPDNRINCTLQARAYYDLIKDAKLRLPPILDFEWTRYAGIQANPNYTDLRKWLAAFTRVSGTKPILYTAAGYVALFGAMPADILDMLSGVWVASYGGTQPMMPKGVSKWDMWQFTANGDALTLCPGNQGKQELDLNYMTEDFCQRYATEPPAEPENGENMVQWYQVNATALNLRSSPSVPSDPKLNDIGDLYRGDRIETTENLGGWVKVIRIWRVGQALPVLAPAEAWCHSGYCMAIDNPITELPAEVAPTEIVVKLSDGSVWKSTQFVRV